jgi:hypothetical protein
MAIEEGFQLEADPTVDRRYTLSLRVSTDKRFRKALRAHPAVAEIVKGKHSTIVLERSKIFTPLELEKALVPLVQALVVRQTTPKPYTPGIQMEERDCYLTIYWFQVPVDDKLLADLKTDPGVKSANYYPKDDYIAVRRHPGYAQDEVKARVKLYCDQFLARQE